MPALRIAPALVGGAPTCLAAARAGFAESRANRAKMYAVGNGVARSATEARYWTRFAITQPDLDQARKAELRNLMAQIGRPLGTAPE